MSSSCFELEGSSSGRWSYMEIRYSVFYMHQYKQSSRQKSVFDTYSSALKTAYTDSCKHTVPYMYIQPSSWRWTLGLEKWRRHQKIKIL